MNELQISNCNITDSGISYLKGLQKLNILNLEGCNVTSACLESISGLLSDVLTLALIVIFKTTQQKRSEGFWLLTPYVRSNEEEESFGTVEKVFNSAHSRAMGLVGTAFARVRAQWQLLSREWKEECMEFLPFVVVTGCPLNNFLMKCT